MRKKSVVFTLISLILISLFLANQTLAAAEVAKSVNYTLEVKDVLTNKEDRPVTDVVITEVLKDTTDNNHPYALLLKGEHLYQPSSIQTDAKGNQIAIYKIPQINPGESLTVGERLYFKGSTANYKLKASDIKESLPQTPELETYLKPSFHIESDNELINKETKKLIANEKNPFLIAQKIYGYVNENMTYDEDKAYSNQGALSALKTHRGVCYEYSSLMVAMLRSAGIPARMVEGYKVDYDKRWQLPNLSDGKLDLSDSSHAWVEFYLPDRGWIPSEPTVLDNKNGQKKITWNYFTKIDSPLYIPINNDVKMETTWSAKGQLEVTHTEALALNANK